MPDAPAAPSPDDDALPSATEVLGFLADDERMRVVASLVLGADTMEGIATRSGLPLRTVAKAVSRLEAGGLVVRDSGRLRFDHGLLRSVVRVSAEREEVLEAIAGEGRGVGAGGADKETARVLRAFFRGGRLVSMPAQLSKKIVVLDRIAQAFEPGVRYDEAEVNDILHGFHEDHAALRRYLVDEEYLEREDGVYWRVGGGFHAGGTQPAADPRD